MKNKTKINGADIYIWIYFLYYLQGYLYPTGIINQILIFIFFLWSFFIGFRYLINIKNKPIIIQATSLLAWMYIFYGLKNIILPITDFRPPYVYLQSSISSIFPIFTIYYYLLNKKLSLKKFQFYIVPFIILTILEYFELQKEMLIEALEKGSTREEFTNNVGYVFLSLIPLILIIKKPLPKYLCLAVTYFFIILSIKRGAILIGALVGLMIIFNDLKYPGKGLKKLQTYIIISTIGFLGSIFVIQFYSESDYFQKRFENTEQGNASGRDIIYKKILDSYQTGSLIELNFGKGADSTTLAAGNYAHDDWLETLHNNGLLGLLLLLLFYFSMLYEILKLNPFLNHKKKIIFYTLFCIVFIKTLFSMSILAMSLPLTMMIGYLAYLSYIKISYSGRRIPRLQ